MRSMVLAAALIVLASGAVASDLEDAIAGGATRITGEDLRLLYADRVWAGETANGTSFSNRLSADGAAELSFKGQVQTGHWRIDGDQGCAAWSKLRNGKEACFTIIRLADGSYLAFSEDGSLNSRLTVD